jgi:putative transcriptional regulator
VRIVKHSRADLDLTKIDWAKVDATADEDIARQIAGDPDTAPFFTETEILSARRVAPNETDDVRKIRRQLGLSQSAFAKRFGFALDTVRQYEAGRRVPAGPIRTLLRVIAREPDAVTRALARGHSSARKRGRR